MSLTPPPCEELTTKEFSLSATLVSPPLTSFTFLLPTRQNGLKSTCLGGRFFFKKIGTEESERVG